MKSLLPLMIVTPPLVQGGFAFQSRRQSNEAYWRSLKVGLAFDIGYLLLVAVISAMLYLE